MCEIMLLKPISVLEDRLLRNPGVVERAEEAYYQILDNNCLDTD